MPRLLVNPRSPNSWQIELKPGANLLGRGITNDFAIDDPSVSSSHCQILVDQTNVLIKDLGSTNGTFVDSAPVNQASIRPGQTIHLGRVEILFQPEALAAIKLEPARAEPRAEPPVTSVAEAVARGAVTSLPTQIFQRPEATPPRLSAPPAATPMPSTLITGAQYCKFHKQTPARFLCNKCQEFFCAACVGLHRASGASHHTCLHCGAECISVQVQIGPTIEKGFFARVPGAFLYPLRGAGIIVVFVGIVALSMIKFGGILMSYGSLRALIFGLILIFFCAGYLFTYLQSIVHSTVAEEKELPDLPGIGNMMEDVVMPFFRLFALFAFCFFVPLGLGIWAAISREQNVIIGALVMSGFGYIYFPMAFLAVAVLDSVFAANPLVIASSIIKAPVQYLFTLIFLAVPWVFWSVCAALGHKFFPDDWTTHSMSTLFLMIGWIAFTTFTAFYLLVVGVHILGLLYVAKRTRLGWL